MSFDDWYSTIIVISVFFLAFAYILRLFPEMSEYGTVIGDRLLRWYSKRKIIKWMKRNCKNHNFEENLDKKCLKFFGFGSDGTALSVEFFSNGIQCDTHFALKLKNQILQHQFKATLPENICEDSITVGGLTLQQIEPFKKWRITFNGILPKNNFINGSNTDNCEQTQHVIFTFFWTAASDPMEWPNNWNPSLLANVFPNTEIDDHLNDLFTSDQGFDQFGSLFGQISINDNISKEVIELNLPGARMVRDVKDDQRTINDSSKIWTFVGTCKDGFVLTLSAKEIENQHKVYVGAVRKPDMDVYSIGTTDFDFKKMEDEIAEMPFNFKAGNEKYQGTLRILMSPKNTTKNCGISRFQQYISFDLNGQPGFGTIITNARYSAQEKVRPLKLLNETSAKLEDSKIVAIKAYTLFFSDVRAQYEELSGGKGASLACLTKLIDDKDLYEPIQSNTFVIPPGFILTTLAFNLQVERNEKIKNAIESLENNTRQSETSEELHSDCAIVQKLFTDTPLEEEIIKSVKTALKNLLINSNGTSKLAVRSSAVGEDGVESSSAGQNETFLGLQTYDDILLAIKRCWASLFSVQSVTYRVQNIQPIRTAMAVVIQSMVSADSAGVLFTSHPSENDPSKLLITANYGLGESVVSGSIDPDVFVVQRDANNNNFKIIERSLGSKTHFIQMSSNESKISEYPVNDEDRLRLCLSDENLLKLCRIGIILQEIYNSHRDIEWAIHKGQIYLLQSRPMTSKNVFSPWELLHEFDSAVMTNEELFTFGNTGEVMPQIMTPLTTSVLIPSFEKGMLKKSIYFNQLMNVSHHRLSINVFMVFMRVVKKDISIENRAHGIAMFGHEFITDEIHRLAKHRFGVASKSLEMQSFWNVIRASWHGKRNVSELEKFMAKFNGTYSRSNLENFSSLMELYDDVSTKLNENFPYVQNIHGLTSMLSTFYQITMFSVLSEGKTELNTKLMSDISILLSSCADAESAEIPVMLEKIANIIMECDNCAKKIDEFININPSDGKDWMRKNCIAAYELFEQFLDKHSHRGLQEFDFGYETWGTCNSLVIEMLQNSIKNLQLNETVREKKTKRSNEEVLAELKTPTRYSTRRLLGFLLPRCQKYVQLREKTKSLVILYINEIRKAFIHLGKEMKAHGYLPDQKLIFYLTYNEIGKLLVNRNRNTHLVNKAIRRRRFFPEWNKMQFDEFQWGVIKPKVKDEHIGEIDKSTLKVTGTPVSAGILTGRVCVVKSFSEVSKIKRGDILIAYSTDIAWSPYFPILNGVVTELGGLISHGAVVAREYGLPCIVGATNATSIFADGDIVHLDANDGVITKIDQNKFNSL